MLAADSGMLRSWFRVWTMAVRMRHPMASPHGPGMSLIWAIISTGAYWLCQDYTSDNAEQGSACDRWSNSHTLTGASGPQLLREWTEQLADGRGIQEGRRGAASPQGDSSGGAHTSRSMGLDSVGRWEPYLPTSPLKDS